jgi:GT2 family glycosyltransferase
MKLSVIVLNYRQPQMTIDCVKQLVKNANNCSAQVEIILLDNGSNDGSIEIIANDLKSLPHDNIIFLQSPNNLGFAAGNNVCIAKASGDWLFLLNNDTIFSNTFLNEMVQLIAKYPDAAAIGPKIYDCAEPSKPWFTGGSITKTFNPLSLARDYTNYTQVDWLTGCALLINRRAIDEIGMLNEDYFAYLEDVEWCMRANQVKAPLIYSPFSRLQHIGSVTTKSQFTSAFGIYYGYRNKLFMISKYAHGQQKVLSIVVAASGILFRIFESAIKGKFENAKAYYFALVDGLLYRPVKRFLRV